MLIVLNADDFGYSRDTVEATIDCCERGLLTGATIMTGMPATTAALDYARSRPDLSFGVHLTFTGSGSERPLTDPSLVRTLVDREGRFRRGRDVRLRALLGRVSVEDVEREARAQIDVVREAGLSVSHVDSHRHLHKFPPFRAALRRVLPDLAISGVRNVQDVYLRRSLTNPTYLVGGVWRRRLMGDFETTDHFYMPTSTGDVNWHELAPRLRRLHGASIEIGVHPGMKEAWRRRERESLVAFVPAAVEQGHELVTWRSILAG
jgi:predicted glycoside hydrolase/deacetylase ChbG (UPF0249 family)